MTPTTGTRGLVPTGMRVGTLPPWGGRVGMLTPMGGSVGSTMMSGLVGIPPLMGGPDPPNGGTWSENQIGRYNIGYEGRHITTTHHHRRLHAGTIDLWAAILKEKGFAS